MSMSIYNNSTPISLHDQLDRREKDEKMGLGRLTGARVDDGLDRAAGLPTTPPPADQKAEIRGATPAPEAAGPVDQAQAAQSRLRDASAARASSDSSRNLIEGQPRAALGAQANQDPRKVMRLLQERV